MAPQVKVPVTAKLSEDQGGVKDDSAKYSLHMQLEDYDTATFAGRSFEIIIAPEPKVLALEAGANLLDRLDK